MNMREEHNRKKRAPRLLRRLILIVTLALALILADALSPYVKNWLYHVLPSVDYHSAAVLLTHEMEKAGELIAVRYTDTGMMTGEINALIFGTVSKLSAPYLYEIGLGIKLEDVKLQAGESELTVTVPSAQVLYDDFRVTGDIQSEDFWGLYNQQRYQQLLDDRHNACRQSYLDDAEYMEKAWETACEQLETLFLQWTGENLQLRFLREGE